MSSYLETIGNTPLVRLERALPEEVRANGATILCKMEMQNPGGSIKDRIAKSMIETAEAEGKLKPGGTVVEYTSGNTGIGLAMVCAAKGYKCIIIMPQLPPFQERYTICRQFGAEVHLTAPAKGFPGLRAYTESLMAANPDYFLANQFYNQANPDIHYATTGPEIWEQTGGKMDYFIAGVGTGGTVAGAGRFLTEKNPDIKVMAVEPTESRVHVGAQHAPHTILGIGPGVATHFLESLAPGAPLVEGPRGHVSEFLHTNSSQAIEWAQRMAQMEGMMVGPSSGAVISAAMAVAARPESAGKTFVVMCASHGIRYTAHPLWAELKDEACRALPSQPNMDKEADVLLWDSAKHGNRR
mmetsp:Transcript_18412/g.46645  ORF Transcript_18412/g.46645 Transcript_18412/m.46645 type:complete len:355 (+) Transcript_18412:181-1245(+)|eukprot:jgi/Tetstr1/422986/TSEL_013763.t1